jgi:Ca-activated chloride channel homolog
MKTRVPFILRAATILLLALSALNLKWSSGDPGLDLVYVLDVSASVNPLMREDALSFIDESMKGKTDRDTASLVLFGGTSALEFANEARLPTRDLYVTVDTSQTNIELALRHAIGLSSSGAARRIILFSDGNETAGDAASVPDSFSRFKAAIYSVPLDAGELRDEAFIQALASPASAEPDRDHAVDVLVRSGNTQDAVLLLTCDDAAVGRRGVKLAPGVNRFSFTNRISRGGDHVYRAVLIPSSDTIAGNNVYESVTRITGKPVYLYLYDPRQPSFLSGMLESQGLALDRADVRQAFLSPARLSGYAAVLCDNLAAGSLAPQSLAALDAYVNGYGGGLFFLCAASSKDLRGFAGTPVEKMLPVKFEHWDRKTSLSLVFVVDKSASMEGGLEQSRIKLDAVKSSVIQSLDRLDPDDRIGLLAFDAGTEWIFRPVRAAERDLISSRLGALETSGGTDIYGALKEARDVLAPEPSALKYIILLSDGNPESTRKYDYRGMAESIARDGMHLTAIAIGRDANVSLMKDLAAWGDGAYWGVEKPSDIAVFDLKEIDRLTGMDTGRGPVRVAAAGSHEILDPLGTGAIPPIDGFYRSVLKETGRNVLATESREPVLSYWQYGAGRVMIFTSNLYSGWANRWASWPQAAALFANSLRWNAARPPEGSFSLTVSSESSRTRCVLNAVAPDGAYINGRDCTVLMTGPDTATTETGLVQTMPGEYSGFLSPRGYGAFQLNAVDRESRGHLAESWLILPYSPELRPARANTNLLSSLAAETGGKVIGIAEKDGPKKISGDRGEAVEQSLDGLFLLLALASFLLDIVLRTTPLGRFLANRFGKKRQPG